MSEVTLILREKSNIPIEADAIRPDTFAGKVVSALRFEFGGHETVPAPGVHETPSCPV